MLALLAMLEGRRGKPAAQALAVLLVIGISVLPPYPGWDDFYERIRNALAAFAEVADSPAVGRVGLRYINRIRIPSIDWRLEVEADAPQQTIDELKERADARCPGVYCLRNNQPRDDRVPSNRRITWKGRREGATSRVNPERASR